MLHTAYVTNILSQGTGHSIVRVFGNFHSMQSHSYCKMLLDLTFH